jgi:hypothetical protein
MISISCVQTKSARILFTSLTTITRLCRSFYFIDPRYKCKTKSPAVPRWRLWRSRFLFCFRSAIYSQSVFSGFIGAGGSWKRYLAFQRQIDAIVCLWKALPLIYLASISIQRVNVVSSRGPTPIRSRGHVRKCQQEALPTSEMLLCPCLGWVQPCNAFPLT